MTFPLRKCTYLFYLSLALSLVTYHIPSLASRPNSTPKEKYCKFFSHQFKAYLVELELSFFSKPSQWLPVTPGIKIVSETLHDLALAYFFLLFTFVSAFHFGVFLKCMMRCHSPFRQVDWKLCSDRRICGQVGVFRMRWGTETTFVLMTFLMFCLDE